MHLKNFFLFSFLLFFFISCNSHKEAPEQLGKINFTVHGNEEAAGYFTKGLLLLHSFEYEDAAENFIAAEKADSTCVMAFWGEAMTYNHQLWRYQDYETGNGALDKLDSSESKRPLKATDPLEKDFLHAVTILYGKGSKASRDSAYAAYMGLLYQKYPGNDEVGAFYSIALLGSVPVGRNDTVYEHAAEIAQEVLKRNPDHPGALHYLIHSYDDPQHAHLALDAADKYAVVAPAAGHALHMPSHIYMAMGMWDKVVSSNEASWKAAYDRMQRRKLTNDALGYHSLHWLEYAYLQQGRNAEAEKLLNTMQAACDTLPSKRAREHLIYLTTTYCIESGNWNDSAMNKKIRMADVNISTRAMYFFTRGMRSYQLQDDKTLAEMIDSIFTDRQNAAGKISGSGMGMCGGVTASMPNLLDVQQAEVVELELTALEQWGKKNDAATDSLFRKATLLENSLSYSFGPPVIVKPSNELYGEWLLENNRASEAMQQFNRSLQTAPNRRLSLEGKMKASKLGDDEKTASATEKTLSEISAKGKSMKNSLN
jgi:hypothetical protein